MTSEIINDFGMFRRVRATLRARLTVISAFPALMEYVQLFFDNFEKLKKTAIDFKNASAGKTKQKHNSVDTVVNELTPMSAALRSHARKEKDEVLLAKVTITPNAIKDRLRQETKLTVIDDILSEAEQHPDVMAASLITPENVATARTDYNKLNSAVDDQGLGVSTRKALRISLEAQTKTENDILHDHIDELIEAVKKVSLDVYNEYFASRVVYDLGGKINLEEDTPPEPPAPPAQ